MKRFLILCSVLALAVAVLPARAGVVQRIGVSAIAVDKPVVRAAAGDTVEFLGTCYGVPNCNGEKQIHRLVSYEGEAMDTGDFSIRGGTACPSCPVEVSFTRTQDGPLRYSCIYHATIDAEGKCTGPCGYLAKNADLAPPTVDIQTPTWGTVTFDRSITFAGTASDDVSLDGIKVMIRDVLSGSVQEYPAECSGCGTKTATWSVTADVEQGSYVVDAVATDSWGRTGQDRCQFLHGGPCLVVL